VDLEGGVVGLRGVEEALEVGAGEVGRAKVGEGSCWGAAGLLLLRMRRARLGRGARRVGVAAGGHGGKDEERDRSDLGGELGFGEVRDNVSGRLHDGGRGSWALVVGRAQKLIYIFLRLVCDSCNLEDICVEKL
jgi:hypothetical protein